MSETLNELQQQQLVEQGDSAARPERAKRLLDFLQRTHAYEYVQRMLKKKELLADDDYKEFESFLIRINGIIKERPIKQRRIRPEGMKMTSLFGGDVTLVEGKEEKERLLREAFDALPMVASGDVKYLIPAVINELHLFNDGNGRTSRVMYCLLESHHSQEDFLSAVERALGEYGRHESPSVDTSLVRFHVEEALLKKYGWIADKDGVAEYLDGVTGVRTAEIQELREHPMFENAKRFLGFSKESHSLIVTSVYAALGAEKMKQLTVDSSKYIRISPRKMLQVLTEEDWKSLNEAHDRLKSQEVEILIDMFVHPQAYHPARPHSESTSPQSLKEYFIAAIQKKYHEDNPESNLP